MQIHFCSVPLSRARIAIRGRTCARMYLRCNTYTRVKGGYAGRGTLATDIVHTYIRCAGVLAAFSCPSIGPSSVADVARAISPDPPWVWYHLPTEIMVFAVDVNSPRAPRTRILYLPEKSSGSLVAHVCASTVCSGRISSRYCPPATGADCARRSFLRTV